MANKRVIQTQYKDEVVKRNLKHDFCRKGLNLDRIFRKKKTYIKENYLI